MPIGEGGETASTGGIGVLTRAEEAATHPAVLHAAPRSRPVRRLDG